LHRPRVRGHLAKARRCLVWDDTAVYAAAIHLRAACPTDCGSKFIEVKAVYLTSSRGTTEEQADPKNVASKP
jgi:hypothetical protein